ncbi:MAG: hypothetical protein Q8K60_06535 [Parachlamydiaceae bacterium]|nr:hypothetical protein [Parachlamydiaceae bacterium]
MTTIQNTLPQLESYSEQMFCDQKTLRQKARREIIRLTDSFKKLPRLKKTEQSLYPTWKRVSNHMTNLIDFGAFPYQIDKKKAGEITCTFPLNDLHPSDNTHFKSSDKSCYIITMAHVPNLNENPFFNELSQQLNLLSTEAFEKNNEDSLQEAKERLAVVIGINFCRSLDKALNRKFKQYVYSANDKLNSSHVKFTAFNWEPIWLKGTTVYSQTKVKRLYQLFADIKPKKAQKTLKELMVNKREIIPYQRIRDKIIKTQEVIQFYKLFNNNIENRPCMLGILDDDTVHFRTEEKGKGILSQYDKLIKNFPDLEVASTGYFMKNPEQDFVELASRADLYARQAIAHIIPNGVYLPEPNLFIKIKSLNMLKNNISFLRKGTGKGKGLEFLGLMENLQLNKGDVKGRVVMGKIGPILTSQPPRVNIPSHMPAILTPSKINNKKNLASLRMFCQTILNPKKGFANSIARALPTGTGSAKNTAKLSAVYTAFDPIDYIKHNLDWNFIYTEFSKTLFKIFNKKIENPDYEPNFNALAIKIINKTHGEPLEKHNISNLLSYKFNNLYLAKIELMDQHPHLTENQFNDVVLSALNANLAVFTYLQSKIDQAPFVFPALYE